jgi:zinc protease
MRGHEMQPRRREDAKKSVSSLITACAVVTLAVASVLGTIVLAQQPPDRSHPPAIGPAPALHLPAIEKRQLSNGLPVWVVEMHEVPVVQVNLIDMRGRANDPVGKFGTANFMTSMLENGAAGHSALEIADQIDFLGAELNTSSNTDTMSVRLHVPVARLGDALPIMADVALRPSFPQDEVERLRQQRLTSLLQARDDPGTIASLAFSRVLYGADHRMGTLQMGTASSIKGLTVADLQAFHQATFEPQNATLLVVGDVTPDSALPLLEKSFGGWRAQGTPAARATLPVVPEPKARGIYLVDKPGAAQSEIRIGWIGVPRSTPDYFPITVMNTLLGGSFQSRLNMNLREEHGYTYGAFSSFDMRSVAGPFTAQAGVQTDKTVDALKEFFNELTKIRELPPADDVTQAKNYVALRYPGAFESTRQIAQQLETMVVYNLPADYFSTYVDKINAVTAADIQRVADKYVQPDKFAVVVVGDRSQIEQGIRGLNLGPIQVVTADQLFE